MANMFIRDSDPVDEAKYAIAKSIAREFDKFDRVVCRIVETKAITDQWWEVYERAIKGGFPWKEAQRIADSQVGTSYATSMTRTNNKNR